jgi:hypothetical protein
MTKARAGATSAAHPRVQNPLPRIGAAPTLRPASVRPKPKEQ